MPARGRESVRQKERLREEDKARRGDKGEPTARSAENNDEVVVQGRGARGIT